MRQVAANTLHRTALTLQCHHPPVISSTMLHLRPASALSLYFCPPSNLTPPPLSLHLNPSTLILTPPLTPHPSISTCTESATARAAVNNRMPGRWEWERVVVKVVVYEGVGV